MWPFAAIWALRRGLAIYPCGRVGIWDLTSGQLIHTMLTDHGRYVCRLAVNSTGDLLLTDLERGRVMLWSLCDFTPIRTLELSQEDGSTELSGMAFHGDLVITRYYYSGTCRRQTRETVSVWRSSQRIHEFVRTTQELFDNFDGHLSDDILAIAGRASSDEVELWDLRSGRHLHTLTGHTDRIQTVGLSRP